MIKAARCVRVSACVCVCVCLFAFVCCCVSNYGLQKPIMIVLPCCDAQDCSLHRQYFVIVVRVQWTIFLFVCVCVSVLRTPTDLDVENSE